MPSERNPTPAKSDHSTFDGHFIGRPLELLTRSRHGLLDALGPDHERTRDAAARLAKIRGDGAADG